MANAKPKRPITGPKAFALIMGLSMLAGGFAGAGGAIAGDQPGPTGFLISLAINGAAMAIAMGLCVWWWRRIDEAAREAHKWAWWWGGCSGMAVGATLLLTLLLRENDGAVSGTMTTNEVLAAGMAVMLGFLLIGYSIGWIVWWAQRR